MKDYKPLYDKAKELISDLGLALQLIHKEIGNKSWISITLDKDLKTIAKRVESITSELHQLEAEIEKEEQPQRTTHIGRIKYK
jgi:hypothetical protein